MRIKTKNVKLKQKLKQKLKFEDYKHCVKATLLAIKIKQLKKIKLMMIVSDETIKKSHKKN